MVTPQESLGPNRRALRYQGGPAQRRGDLEVAEVLAAALEAVDVAERDPLTHGLHAYPARMHYAIARGVLEGFSGGPSMSSPSAPKAFEPRTRVLDPFCGSGTVLVEARRLGLRACGVDLNPLALRIAEIKQAVTSEAQRDRLAELGARVVGASLDRVDRRERVRAPLSPAERQWYEPHVLLGRIWIEQGPRAQLAKRAEGSAGPQVGIRLRCCERRQVVDQSPLQLTGALS